MGVYFFNNRGADKYRVRDWNVSEVGMLEKIERETFIAEGNNEGQTGLQGEKLNQKKEIVDTES